MRTLAVVLTVFCCLLACASGAFADALGSNSLQVAARGNIPELLVQLARAEPSARRELFIKLAQTGDQRLESIFQQLIDGSLYLWRDQVVACPAIQTRGDQKWAPLSDPVSLQPILADGKPVVVPAAELKEFSASRRDRIFIRDALTYLRLSNPNRDDRLAAVVKAGESGAESSLPPLKKLAAEETDSVVRAAVEESIALIELNLAGEEPQIRASKLDAAKRLGNMASGRAMTPLKEWLAKEKDKDVRAVLAGAINKIENWQRLVDWVGVIFSGLSASSILILMALGLSIVFGLMGVINMAHGELMMIGAYATFLVQQLFAHYLPAGAFDWYFVAAIPISFIAAGIAGVVLEAGVIRFLYGRPLETLLATWGVSLILIQIIRVAFGDNIAVNSPTWLRGSYEIMQDIRLPYNRMFIIGFCVICIGLMYFIVEKTRLGLLLRATTQNRPMAATLGVSTRKIDMLTFGLGAGLAGLAGCALTQVGGVTPDMGQNYVIDSFLVVVTGGVGKLAGAIWTGLGLGMINKLLEPLVATVWAKVLILILVVAFIQRKPSGLFPAKGRMADA